MTVCSWDSACVIILIIYLQTTVTPCDDGVDPIVDIRFASDASIDNCLSLNSLRTVGPANDVPSLRRGIVSTTMQHNYLKPSYQF